MFVLTIEQKNYNRVKFYFDSADEAAAFINNCMTYDDGITSYKLEYEPEFEEENEEDGN